MSADKPDGNPATTERMIMFSDAVVAIAITLLALELPVPDGDTFDALLRSVGDNRAEYTAFFISFFVIAACWSLHHGVFRHIAFTDARLLQLNAIWLMLIVLNPFATKVLTAASSDTHAVRFGFYALLQLLAAAVFLAMVRHAFAHELQSADAPEGLLTKTTRRCCALMAGFVLSIPLLLVIPWAWVLWIATPSFTGQIADRWGRRRPPPLGG